LLSSTFDPFGLHGIFEIALGERGSSVTLIGAEDCGGVRINNESDEQHGGSVGFRRQSVACRGRGAR
jgi:hypothetical protein